MKPRYHTPEPIESPSYEPGPLLSLRSDQCRFTTVGTTMCGARTMRNRAWCPHHAGIVYTKHSWQGNQGFINLSGRIR